MELDVTQMMKQSQWTSISQCSPKSDVLTLKQTRNTYRNKDDASTAKSKATWHASALPRRSNPSDPIRDRSARISSRSDLVRLVLRQLWLHSGFSREPTSANMLAELSHIWL